jgi:TRAP-type mannitol/chloroaromatic compound transport system permease large subunit
VIPFIIIQLTILFLIIRFPILVNFLLDLSRGVAN